MAETTEITTVLVSEEQLTNKDNCVICFVRFAHNESVKRLQCSHIYHIKCIDTWLTTKKSCPICRLNVLPEEENENPEIDLDVFMGNIQRVLDITVQLTISISGIRQTINALNAQIGSMQTEMTNRNGTQMRHPNGTNEGGAIRRSNRLRQRSQANSVQAPTNASDSTRLSRIVRRILRRRNPDDHIS